MSFFSRMLKRSRPSSSSGRTHRPGLRMLQIEPLEERRLLTHITAPLDFKVQHVPGPLAEEIKLKLSWTDSSGETGYEVERSITGRDDPDGLWEGGFHENLPADKIILNIDDVFRRYYFRIRSTGHTGSHSESPWSAPVYAKGTFTSPTANIIVPEDKIVKVSAIAHSQIDVPLIAATIELRWPLELAYEDADYTISRKQKDELSYTQVASLTYDGQNPITGWTDTSLGNKTAYEYEVERTRKNNAYFNSTTTQGIGYVYAGVDVPLDDDDSTIESPGTVILIVDNTQADALTAELIRLEDDLYAEGWDVIRHDVIRHDVARHDDDPLLNTHEDVRDLIIADYTADPTNVKSVFLIGHVPVPMSGWNNPDGHGPRPFPADVFYGDVDGDWTDTTRNTDLRGYQGNYRYNDAGTGDDVASWTFTGLTPGDYEVSVSWKKDTNRATNAPFTIFDDSTEVAGPILVNQRFTATANHVEKNTPFKIIAASVTINSDTLVVQLSDDANGRVIADAVRIEMLDPSPPPPVIIDNDEPGFSTTGTWKLRVDGSVNLIGDGVFDQQTVPDDGDGKPVELMVGRVDMHGLSDFSESETELLRRYLDKDHAFRTGQVAVERKARIRDRFARTYSSTGAWQTMSGFFGPAESPTELEPDNIDVNKWTDTNWPLAVGLRSGKMAGIWSWPGLSLAL